MSDKEAKCPMPETIKTDVKKDIKAVKKVAKLMKSRTVKFSMVLAVMSMLQGFIFTLPLTPVHQMFIGLGLSLGSVILRVITKQPIDEL